MNPLAPALLAFFFAASAYYSGFETGVYALNKVRLRIRANRGEAAARRVLALLEDMPGLLATLMVGNNLAVDGASFAFILLLAGQGVEDPEYVATLVMTPALFLFGEVLPKNLFRLRPNALVYPLSLFALLSQWAFLPLVAAVRLFSAAVAHLGSAGRTEKLFSRQRLGYILHQGVEEGVVPPVLQNIAQNILRLGKTYLRQVMVPIGRAAVLRRGDGAEALKDLARRTGFSRFPVLGDRGRVEGVVHIFDLAGRDGDEAIEPLLHKPVEFHAEFPIDDALFILQRRNRPMAVIVSSDGAAVGIVTVKDLVEEIVGEIAAW